MSQASQRRCGLPLGLLVAAVVALSPAAVPAQTQSSPPSAATADEAFSRQLGELKKSFSDIAKRIEDSAKSIDATKNPDEGRKSLEELREHVGRLLGSVADNGEVSNLGRRALARAEDKLKSLEADARFKADEKQYLVDKWRELRASTEKAIRELDGARKDFAELLRTLQTNEDYIDELMQISEHEKALQVIHQLTTGIRDASSKLQKLLGAIKPPGA